jgi:hypothetical protein
MRPRVRETRVFAAYPYVLNPSYLEMLHRIEADLAVRFRLVNDTPAATHLAQKVRVRIAGSDFSMFDLSGWNANVAFEFGIFMGMNLPMTRAWLFLNRNTSDNVPSDIQGLHQQRYADLAGLEALLRANLSHVRRRSDVVVLSRPL